jgi:hypothetical protein
MNKMAIDSKKILGDTKTEWLQEKRKKGISTDYISEGVHYSTGNTLARNLLKEFAKCVPNEAEVVVNYRISGNYFSMHAWGTALIPEKECPIEGYPDNYQ